MMATIQELEQALINADKAGDVEAAQVLAGEIMRMRGMGAQIKEAEQNQSRQQMSHPFSPSKPKDSYTRTAQDQSFMDNVLSGAGGAMYGMGYLGPKSMLGLDKPGEVADWKASMSGLGSTIGGTIGQIGGYAAPMAIAAPMMGASVPVAAAVGAGEGMLMPAESWGERGVNTLASTVGAATGQAGGNALAGVARNRAAAKTAELAAAKSRNAPIDATRLAAIQSGYKIPPSTVNPTLWNRVKESIAGKAAVQQAASGSNQDVTNALARKAAGLADDAPITGPGLKQAREVIAKPYQQARKVVGDDMIDSLITAKEEANELWKMNLRNPTLETRNAARDATAQFKAIEKQVDDALVSAGKPELAGQIAKARVSLAKNFDVDAALIEGSGDVNARTIGNMTQRGEPLTDELKVIGDFANTHPKLVQPDRMVGSPGVSKLAAGLGSLLAGGGAISPLGPGGMALGAVPFAVPWAMQKRLLSKSAQKALIPNYELGLAQRAVTGLLDNPVSSALYPGAGVFGYGLYPNLE